ncbi:MAG TPA: BadF/BadG/BcrA/BcrD ATPase family protein [Lachnospiraceae bacterium]|nr:BadF/BadG/BcrA/BcrD ATPase family protein [Lachnospiraceae bacterium]
MRYFCGCDVGSTYAKCVILDENGKMISDATIKSKINPSKSSELVINEAISKTNDIEKIEDISYLVGTGYGRNKVMFADENISEISCHAMGVHVTDPNVKANTVH